MSNITNIIDQYLMTLKDKISDASTLCQSCGMCCDGTFFSKVDVIEEEKTITESYSRNVNLELSVSTKKHFAQPCICFDENRGCEIYRDRPEVCRTFKCGLLSEVLKQERSLKSAKRVVNQARKSSSKLLEVIEEKASFLEHRPVLQKFRILFGNVTNIQSLAKENQNLIQPYMQFALTYEIFFPKKKLLKISKNN